MSSNGSAEALNPQAALLDTFFPGFSLISTAIYRYLKIDVTSYIPFVLAVGLFTFLSQYSGDYLWGQIETHLMSTADVRVDDEMYNMLMSWVAKQNFSQHSRRFVVNVNLSSRMWWLWSHDEQEQDEEEEDGSVKRDRTGQSNAKPLQYTPSFGTHFFWYKGHLLLFKRSENTQQSYAPASEREEISVASFGRSPAVLKELMNECRSEFLKNDENKTLIYRGNVKGMSTEPTWTRCMSRVSRPFSTVVLDEDVKQELVDDLRDYLNPLTRRWYANRGIPYRRGYLLYGPPGTGKSSLSFAIAGYFKLKIYIVSLNSPAMSEENLSNLFDELPQKCVVLLEDIDTAGLTHTRETPEIVEIPTVKLPTEPRAPPIVSSTTTSKGRISLSALLNVIDGVASHEGRVLIMTTNHIDQLDEALIRPGRVDLMVKFDYASTAVIATLFRGIFTTLEGDIPKDPKPQDEIFIKSKPRLPKHVRNVASTDSGYNSEKETTTAEQDEAASAKADAARISLLADQFAAIIPSHTFSPAEIQGFLLKHKRAPEKAIEGAAEWVDTTKTKRKLEMERKAKEEEEAAKAQKKAEEEESKKKDEAEKEKKNAETKSETEATYVKVEAQPVAT